MKIDGLEIPDSVLKPKPPKKQRNWCFPFLHDWTRWEKNGQVEYGNLWGGVGGVAVIQQRHCLRCNKLQSRQENVA